MSVTILQELGLTPNEAKIYHALLTHGGSGVSPVSLHAKVHRRNAYDALRRLRDKGLVTEVKRNKETTFEPVDPAKLLELMKAKEAHLVTELPTLQNLYRTTRPTETSAIYKGQEGMKHILEEALRSKELLSIGNRGAWYDERMATFMKKFLATAKKKKLKIRCLFDHSITSLKKKSHDFADEEHYLPEKHSMPATIDVFGDTVVTYTTTPGKLSDSTTLFVITSPTVADSYRALWNMLTESAKGGKKGWFR